MIGQPLEYFCKLIAFIPLLNYKGDCVRQSSVCFFRESYFSEFKRIGTITEKRQAKIPSLPGLFPHLEMLSM